MKEFWLSIFGAILDVFRRPDRKPEEEPDIPAPPTPPVPEDPGTTHTDPTPLEEPPDSGFVWKPVSDGDGKLAVICPYQYDFANLFIEYVKKGDTLSHMEKGRYIGRGNGQRQAFRFARKGRYYGKKITVVGLGAGGRKEWTVPDGAKRFELRDYGT